VVESLIDKKKGISRKIGNAKRAGESIEELLVQMKQVTQQIKTLEQDRVVDTIKEKEACQSDGVSSDIVVDRSSPQLFAGQKGGQGDIPLSDIVINELEGDSLSSLWNAYVEKTPGSSLYHRWEFREQIKLSFGHETIYLAALNEAGEICGVLPAVLLSSRLFGRFIISMPFFNYGSVLADSQGIEGKLIDALIGLAKSKMAEHVELRSVCSREGMLLKTNKVAMILPLPTDSNVLWQDIGAKVRSQIKKANRFDLRMEFGKSELLDDFYQVFATNMRDLGTPVYSRTFFQNLITCELQEQFHIGVVYKDGSPVSCCFLMGHKDMLEIPWASTLSSFNHMNANMFMYWEILKKAISEKYDFFDFGRSSKDAGTFRFKKQWGAKPEQLYWHYWLSEGGALPELNPNNPKYRLIISVWQRMPVWLTKLIGPRLVKFLP